MYVEENLYRGVMKELRQLRGPGREVEPPNYKGRSKQDCLQPAARRFHLKPST